VRIGRLALLSQYRGAGEHWVERIRTPGVTDLGTSAKVKLRRSLRARWFTEGWLPAQRSTVGVHVKDAKARFAPPRSAVLDYRNARPKPGDEATDDKVGRVGTTRGRFEGGKVHGHPDLVRLRSSVRIGG